MRASFAARPRCRGLIARGAIGLLMLSGAHLAQAGYYPVEHSWPQPDGAGSAITLTYSFSNLLDGSLRMRDGTVLSAESLNGAFQAALADYAAFLPIHFVEVPDNAGPLPETGNYDPTGLANIRVGQVADISGANAYAYYPISTSTNGLAGDVVFSANRWGQGWTMSFFYAVAQHELGHSLGMAHYVSTGASSSDVSNAALAGYDGTRFPLDPEAVSALQAVYGAGVGSVTPLSAVPEPSVWMTMALGLATLAWRTRARRVTP